ncbi:MAG: diaminopimelate decarboxylase [Bacteroidota bacterium]
MNLKNDLSKIKGLKTPFFYYDMEMLQLTLDELKKCLEGTNYHVHYALKANVNEPILKLIKDNGLGADCVSGNEVKRALESGFDPKDVVFAGVGKSDDEISYALDQDIFAFNCESVQELEVINEMAGQKGKTAHVALRLNPNVDPETHQYITTGLNDNKFGISLSGLDVIFNKHQEWKNIKIEGIHFHIGSQVTKLEKYRELSDRVNGLIDHFEDKGIDLSYINLGGGLGIDYENPEGNPIAPFKAYFDIFKNHLNIKSDKIVHFELGRSIVGQCGALVSKVLYTKEGENTNFLIVDGGMTELIRPALYQAYHKIVSLTSERSDKKYDVVGPICETSDFFGKGVNLAESGRGDLIAVLSAGAYAEVMSSSYNLREKAKSVYSDQL